MRLSRLTWRVFRAAAPLRAHAGLGRWRICAQTIQSMKEISRRSGSSETWTVRHQRRISRIWNRIHEGNISSERFVGEAAAAFLAMQSTKLFTRTSQRLRLHVSDPWRSSAQLWHGLLNHDCHTYLAAATSQTVASLSTVGR